MQRTREVDACNHLSVTRSRHAGFKNPDNDPRGPWTRRALSGRNFYSAGTYEITSPVGYGVIEPPQGRYWTVSQEKFKELDGDNRIWWGKDGTATPLRQEAF